MDKFVVGQHEAKRTLSVGIYQHYKRLANNYELKRQQAVNTPQGQQQGNYSSHHQHVSNSNSGNMFQSGNLNGNYGSFTGSGESYSSFLSLFYLENPTIYLLLSDKYRNRYFLPAFNLRRQKRQSRRAMIVQKKLWERKLLDVDRALRNVHNNAKGFSRVRPTNFRISF